jgi:hypothetical protein
MSEMIEPGTLVPKLMKYVASRPQGMCEDCCRLG